MSFEITRSKVKYKSHQPHVENPITYEEWVKFVESDSSLTWFDDTENGIEFYSDFGKDTHKKWFAYYLYSASKKEGILDLSYSSVIPIIKAEIVSNKKESLKKIFEIADKFDAKVYKLGKEIQNS